MHSHDDVTLPRWSFVDASKGAHEISMRLRVAVPAVELNGTKVLRCTLVCSVDFNRTANLLRLIPSRVPSPSHHIGRAQTAP